VPRPRDLNIPLGFYEPGPHNAITDVRSVRVGHTTVRETDDPGAQSDIHTGVTCIWPHEAWPWEEAVFAATHVLNGHGELIGITEVNEWGLLRSPLLLTSSLYIGAVYDATARWAADVDERQGRSNFFMPAVAEVSDNMLSDGRRFPLTRAHVEQALIQASTEPPAQGAVGAGTGTICYALKGGIGSASRVVHDPAGSWTVGALVLTNYGERRNLTIAGVPVGTELDAPAPPDHLDGSCIVVVATDAPMLPHQLRRLALRASIGLTRSGGFAGHYSGEITIAFSTAARVPLDGDTVIEATLLRDGANEMGFNRLFEGAVEAVNEAVLNCLFEATTTRGRNGVVAHALPIDQTLEILARRGVIAVRRGVIAAH
jgi:D-aminopeptidase